MKRIPMFCKGDLVYVPQNVAVYSLRLGYRCLSKLASPKLAVFLKYAGCNQLAKIAMLDGSLWEVDKNDIYFSKSPGEKNVS